MKTRTIANRQIHRNDRQEETGYEFFVDAT